jgi:hypothetical protein
MHQLSGRFLSEKGKQNNTNIVILCGDVAHIMVAAAISDLMK